MLEVSNFAKTYGDVTAVTDSSFTIQRGEVFGLVGPNGAGKTTTLKAIVGLIEPTHGTVTVSDRSPTMPAVRQEIGWLPEETALYDDMTADSYLNFFADLYDVPQHEADTRITDTLDRLALEQRDRRLSDCSKGMRRKVAMARALINDPSLVVYDEPASGLDPQTTREVITATRDLAAEGKTIVFSAHDLHHVEEVCDRIAIMREGDIAMQGRLREIREQIGDTTYVVFTDIRIPGAEEVGNRFRITVDDVAGIDRVRSETEAADGRIVEIRSQEPTLEDVFISITG